MKRFNDWFGDKIAHWLSTMLMFYIVTAFVLLPLIFQRPHDLVGWVQYLVQSFFQGAALPVLGYVSRRSGEKQEKVLLETHDTVMQEMCILRETARLQHLEQKEIKRLLIAVEPSIKQD